MRLHLDSCFPRESAGLRDQTGAYIKESQNVPVAEAAQTVGEFGESFLLRLLTA